MTNPRFVCDIKKIKILFSHQALNFITTLHHQSRNYVKDVGIPLLCLNSLDDPFLRFDGLVVVVVCCWRLLAVGSSHTHGTINSDYISAAIPFRDFERSPHAILATTVRVFNEIGLVGWCLQAHNTQHTTHNTQHTTHNV